MSKTRPAPKPAPVDEYARHVDELYAQAIKGLKVLADFAGSRSGHTGVARGARCAVHALALSREDFGRKLLTEFEVRAASWDRAADERIDLKKLELRWWAAMFLRVEHERRTAPRLVLRSDAEAEMEPQSAEGIDAAAQRAESTKPDDRPWLKAFASYATIMHATVFGPKKSPNVDDVLAVMTAFAEAPPEYDVDKDAPLPRGVPKPGTKTPTRALLQFAAAAGLLVEEKPGKASERATRRRKYVDQIFREVRREAVDARRDLPKVERIVEKKLQVRFGRPPDFGDLTLGEENALRDQVGRKLRRARVAGRKRKR